MRAATNVQLWLTPLVVALIGHPSVGLAPLVVALIGHPSVGLAPLVVAFIGHPSVGLAPLVTMFTSCLPVVFRHSVEQLLHHQQNFMVRIIL